MNENARAFVSYTANRLHDTAELISDVGAAMRLEMSAAELQAAVLRNDRFPRKLGPMRNHERTGESGHE